MVTIIPILSTITGEWWHPHSVAVSLPSNYQRSYHQLWSLIISIIVLIIVTINIIGIESVLQILCLNSDHTVIVYQHYIFTIILIKMFSQAIIAMIIIMCLLTLVTVTTWACHVFAISFFATGAESEHKDLSPTSSLPLLWSSNRSTWTLLTPWDTLLQLDQRPFSDILARLSRVALKGASGAPPRGKEAPKPLHSTKLTPQLLSRRLAPVSAGPAPPQSDAISGSTQDLEEHSNCDRTQWKSIFKQY